MDQEVPKQERKRTKTRQKKQLNKTINGPKCDQTLSQMGPQKENGPK